MPVIDIKNGQFVEQTTKTKTSASTATTTSPSAETSTPSEQTNLWLNILTNKFNLILIGIIILLGYLLYRAYKSE